MAGDVAEVVNLDPALEQRAHDAGVHHGPVEQRLAERAPARERRPVAVVEPFGDAPRQRRAVRVKAAAGTITISSPGARSAPRIGPRPGGTTPTALPASSMSSGATSPGSDGDSPPPQVAPASTHASRQPVRALPFRLGCMYQSEDPVAKYALTTSGTAPTQQSR